MYLVETCPPFRHAASTIYLCLKWDLYDVVFARRLRVRNPLGVPIDDGGVAARVGILLVLVECGKASQDLCGEHNVGETLYGLGEGVNEKHSKYSLVSSDILLYACLSHSIFQVISSFKSSCHLVDTCDARARVFGSSINARTCTQRMTLAYLGLSHLEKGLCFLSRETEIGVYPQA